MRVERNRASSISVARLNEDPEASAKRRSAIAVAFLSLRRHDPDQVRKGSLSLFLIFCGPAVSQSPNGEPPGRGDYRQSAGPASRLRFGDAFGPPLYQAQTRLPEVVEHGSAAMIVWRVAGWILLLAGLSVLVRDLIAGTIRGVGAARARPVVVRAHRSSLNLVEAVVQRYLSPFLWNWIIVNLLLCWASTALIALGAVHLLLTRPPALPRSRSGTMRRASEGYVGRQKSLSATRAHPHAGHD